ncbi:MAG TPA: membrane protein, partial [Thermomicrobiales bacterium]|nr:membrane protein [Thermomicrobiales bacterium]
DLLLRLCLLIGGLFLFALAMALSLQCNLGAASWTVLHDGISRQTPLSIGVATQLVGFLMLGVSWLAGIRPGLGTLANMILVGLFLDLILWVDIIPLADAYPLRVLMLLAGIVLLGLASALYIKAGFGAGPRDSFMLAVHRRTRLRIGKVRWLMEVSAVVVGVLLGGAFGIGTIIFAMLVGLTVDFFFNLLNVRVSPAVEPKIVAVPVE